MSTIYQRLTAFNAPLLPNMVQFKYELMAQNVFTFYRGTCHLFYEDLATAKPLPPSPLTWLCGDLHLENFGSYKADNHLVYFDINDFDEGILSTAAWDLTRMVTSIFVAFENLELKEGVAAKMAAQFLTVYSATLSKGKAIGLDPRTTDGIVCEFLTTVEKRKQKDLLKQRTIAKKKKLSLVVPRDKHLELDKPLKEQLAKHINQWTKTSHDAQYNLEVIDSVFRLAGTGSVGVKRYLFLLKSLNTKNKYLLLDMKQARPSSLQPYVKIKQPQWATEADRVIAVQQRMQNVLPALEGTTIFDGEAYTLQKMQPTEDKINFELIKDRNEDISKVIDDMAILTASAQLRSSGRQGSAIADELITYGKNTGWHTGILNYAATYAVQVKQDYTEYVKGYNSGEYSKSQR